MYSTLRVAGVGAGSAGSAGSNAGCGRQRRAGASSRRRQMRNVLPAPTSLSHLDAAGHQLQHAPGQGQADAGALDRAVLGAEALEGGEQPRPLLLAEAEAGVGDGEPRLVGPPP